MKRAFLSVLLFLTLFSPNLSASTFEGGLLISNQFRRSKALSPVIEGSLKWQSNNGWGVKGRVRSDQGFATVAYGGPVYSHEVFTVGFYLGLNQNHEPMMALEGGLCINEMLKVTGLIEINTLNVHYDLAIQFNVIEVIRSDAVGVGDNVFVNFNTGLRAYQSYGIGPLAEIVMPSNNLKLWVFWAPINQETGWDGCRFMLGMGFIYQ